MNPRHYFFILNGGIVASEVIVIDETIKWTLSKKLTSRLRHIETHTYIQKYREWMGRDLNSRPPVCKTGILTRLDYPSGKTARQLSGSILIVFGVAIIVATFARGAIIIAAANRTSFFQTTMGKMY